MIPTRVQNAGKSIDDKKVSGCKGFEIKEGKFEQVTLGDFLGYSTTSYDTL